MDEPKGSADAFRGNVADVPLPTFAALRLERRSRALTIAFDRPDTLNSFDARMHAELPRALAFAAADPLSDVVVLTGRGRAFSAGGDIAWQQAAADRPELFEATVREARAIVFGIIDCEKPIIARVNGPAVGLGATIALLCDASFVARSTYLADPHVSIGMVAGDGGAIIWPQLVGFARAKRYLFTGDRIAAEEAERIGLVTQAVDDERLGAVVDAFADRLADGARLAIRYSKVTANIALRQLMTAALDVGLGFESLTNVSPDHREALAAFRERRPRRFASGVQA